MKNRIKIKNSGRIASLLPTGQPATRNDTKNNKNAFTLIELLLGLGLFSVIGLIVYSTFMSGIRLSRSFDVENEVYREVRLTFDLMSQELENMSTYDFSGSNPEQCALKGEKDKINFLSFVKDQLKVIQYSLDKPTDSRIYQTIIGGTYAKNVSTTLVNQYNQKIGYLIREERSFFDAFKKTPEQKPDFEIISTHVQENSLKFSYGYFENEQATELSWRDDWNLQYLPKAVRVEFDYRIDHTEKSKSSAVETLHFLQNILIPSAKGLNGSAT